ncbi:MAG: hypothetical protein LBK58_08435 [Prevotellaceae bacterium]|jgi:hypothetical protein|nr:hypothetical protein [Prevotellaceae bacterium]
MKKKLLLFTGMLAIGTIAAFNIHVVENEVGDIRLQNIEMLSFGENEYVNCFATGSLNCPVNGAKVMYTW